MISPILLNRNVDLKLLKLGIKGLYVTLGIITLSHFAEFGVLSTTALNGITVSVVML
jgi:hypothetical protein